MRFYILCFLSLIALSCASRKEPVTKQFSLANHVNSAVNKNHHVGFVLKDLENNKVLFEHNADKNFTAASNIKLLNFYAGILLLGDSVPSFKYCIKGDSLLVWPMADPTFLHPSFKSQKAFDFLKNSGKDIYIISGSYKGEKYGKGWAWDDYNESYQTEITEFPIYGNVMIAKRNTAGEIAFIPDLESLYFLNIHVDNNLGKVKRNVNSNDLLMPSSLKEGHAQKIPIYFNNSILESILSDTLLATGLITSSVKAIPYEPVCANAKTIYSVKTKDVLELMLKNSDNFLAEQMLLNYAAANNLPMDVNAVIAKLMQSSLLSIKSSIQWVDGSGLSRLNLVSPKAMVYVLEEARNKLNNDEELLSYLPIGGKSGTLKNMFLASPQPFVYAKSGTLSNNYNLSGYLVGKSGKLYAFSYLNNNYTVSSKEIKTEIESVLHQIYLNY